MNIMDMTDDQLGAFLEQGQALSAAGGPLVADLWQNISELTLRLREIKGLAIEHATKGTKVPADTLIRLLEGRR